MTTTTISHWQHCNTVNRLGGCYGLALSLFFIWSNPLGYFNRDDELPPLGGHVTFKTTLSNYHKWQMAFYICKRRNEWPYNKRGNGISPESCVFVFTEFTQKSDNSKAIFVLCTSDQDSLLAIIDKYGVPISQSAWLYQPLLEVLMNKIALWINVCADDWTDKRGIIGSNVVSFRTLVASRKSTQCNEFEASKPCLCMKNLISVFRPPNKFSHTKRIAFLVLLSVLKETFSWHPDIITSNYRKTALNGVWKWILELAIVNRF